LKTLVLDSHALLAFFEREAGWEKITNFLQEAAAGKCRLVMSVVNWGEVCYVTLREYGEDHLERVRLAMDHMPVEIMPAGREVALEAARFKARGGLSYADSYVCGLAMIIKGANIITGDPEFHAVEKTIRILWI
jgi:PIN domain nuclease of toxin-antitoxin system